MRSLSLPRRVGTFGVVAAGVLGSEAVAGEADWLWLALVLAGFAAGLLARRPTALWIAVGGTLAADALGLLVGFAALRGIFWPVLAAAHVLVVGLALVVGAAVSPNHDPLGRRWRVALVTVVAVALVGLGAWSTVLGVVYSETYITQEAGARHDCRTPGSRFGWPYEAINYDQADDARLLASVAAPAACEAQFTSEAGRAGSAVTSVDGTPIAGWYIPAADAAVGPHGPTLVLVHGGKSNKSGMLDYAPALHQDYNLVLVDLRNTGRSRGDRSSGGLWERYDVRALVDWLASTKQPTWIGLVANSNGAATGLAEAVDDPRIRALVLDSMHARIVTQLGNIAETELEPRIPAWPGALAVILGASLRVGGDIQSVDPIRMLPRIGTRPVLLTHGTKDHVDTLAGALQPNLAAAFAADVDVGVRLCVGADHGEVINDCPDQWGEWVRSFLAEARSRS